MTGMFLELYSRIINLFAKYPSDAQIDQAISEAERGQDHPNPEKNRKKTCELNLPGGRYACRNNVKVHACEFVGVQFGGNGVSRDEPCL